MKKIFYTNIFLFIFTLILSVFFCIHLIKDNHTTKILKPKLVAMAKIEPTTLTAVTTTQTTTPISFEITSSTILNFHNEIDFKKAQNIKTASLLNFGDLMLDRNVKKQIDSSGSDYILEKLAQDNNFFGKVDVVAANLEGAFANSRRPTSKSIAFRFDPMLIEMLKKNNFSLFNLANNHSLDMGKAGFKETQDNLKKAGIDYYGQQYKVDDDNILLKQVGDFKIGFIGLDDTINKVSVNTVQKLIKKLKDQGAEIILANIHWGNEYKKISNSRQRELAHALIDSGVNIIIGHHPHVVEEMEIYKSRPIFYSLGNFVFDQYFSTDTQQELAVGLLLTQEDKEPAVSIYVLPLVSNRSQISQMDTTNTKKFFADWNKNNRLEGNEFKNFNLKINL